MTRVQASLLLPDCPSVELRRQRWNPELALKIPAHVTLIYDDEAPDGPLMIERLRNVCATVPAISLHLGRVAGFGSPPAGLFAETQAGKEFETIRKHVLTPPFAPRSGTVTAHATILHPRYAPDAPNGWAIEIGAHIEQTVLIDVVSIIAWSDERWSVVERVALSKV
jgi:hypothetical protein